MKKTTIVVALLCASLLADAQSRRSSSSSSRSRTSSRSSSSHGKRRHTAEPGRKFNFSLGISLAVSNTVTTTLSDANGSAVIVRSAVAAGIFAYPKYSFYSAEKFSISIGIPLTIAFSASANSETGTDEGSSSFLYDLPLMIDYNGGVMAPQQRHSDKRFGYFGGVGIGIENTDASSYSYVGSGSPAGVPDYTKAKSVGPNLHAGFVFRIGSEDRPRFIGARLSYKIGLNKDKFNYFTPSIFLNI